MSRGHGPMYELASFLHPGCPSLDRLCKQEANGGLEGAEAASRRYLSHRGKGG